VTGTFRPGLDEATFSLLHEIRLRGLVQIDADEVALLAERGYVQRAARGVRITVEGRAVHTAWARVTPGSDAEAAAQRAYERFLSLNRELVRICHDWQVRPGGVTNDHRDAHYDYAVLDRLHTLDERAGPVVILLAGAVERFTVYRPSLRTAIARIDEGEHAWLASPRCDSYHTVWMRLHEDLLLALGADRASEASE